MNPDSLLLAARWLAVLAVLVLVVQWFWVDLRQKRVLRDQMQQRLVVAPDADSEGSARVSVGHLEGVLLQSGIRVSRPQLAVSGLVLLLFVVVIALIRGPLTAAIIAGLIIVTLWMYWRFRLQKQRRLIYQELPQIIDTTLRYVDAGRSLENALVEAFKDAPAVFDPLSFRLRSAVESGRDYTELFEDFAALYGVPSLVTVAIALRTSGRFGSSIRPVLKQVSSALRAQQELRREFLAATAEVRFTAAAFALLPMGIAAYMILMNESYSKILLDSHTGHVMLMIAGGLQALGVLIIWRMIQGVGRD